MPSTLPLPSAPTGRTVISVFSVAYALPGVDLRLDMPTLCQMLAGRVAVWNVITRGCGR